MGTFVSDQVKLNPLNAELNPIRHLLALVGARHIVHVSRIRVNTLKNGLKLYGHMVVPFLPHREQLATIETAVGTGHCSLRKWQETRHCIVREYLIVISVKSGSK